MNEKPPHPDWKTAALDTAPRLQRVETYAPWTGGAKAAIRQSRHNRKGEFMETAGQEIGKIETRLRQLGAKLDRLAAKADEAQNEVQTEAKLDYRRLVDLAKSKQAVVRGKLDAYKAANGQKWDNFKEGVEVAWRDLASAFKAVKQ
jgi:hypothetical protein